MRQDAPADSDDQLHEVLAAAGIARWEWLVETDELLASPELLAMLRLEPGRCGVRLADLQARLHPDEQTQLAPALLAGARHRLDVRVDRGDGTTGWIRLTGARRLDPAGRPVRVAGIAEDLTERTRADQRARFLEEAGDALAVSLDYEATLGHVARLAVPRLADWCAIDMLRPDGSIELVAIHHVDPDRVRWARELREHEPPDPAAPTGVPAVLRSGQPVFYPHITDEMLAASARDPERLALARQLAPSSVMIVPLVARGQTLGAITLFTAESRRSYGEEDLALAEELARRAAIAVDNARLFRAEQEALAALQHVLTITPDFEHARTLDELAHRICLGAVDAFECTAASLWRMDGEDVELLARSEPAATLPVGLRIPTHQMEDIFERLVERRPAFVAQPASYDKTDIGDYAVRQRIGSALLLPIVIEGRVASNLSLTWRDAIPEPSAGVLAAAQRYADQAGLALENARRREAQREAEALSASLDRLLALAPSFRRAGDDLDAIARTIAEAAVETFGSDAAALWERDGDRVRLLARLPLVPQITLGRWYPVERYAPVGLLEPRAAFVADAPGRYAERGLPRPDVMPRSLLRAPIMHAGAVGGALVISWQTPAPEPSPGVIAVLQRFADQAALALEEARLRAVEREAAVLHGQLEASLLAQPQLRSSRVQVSRLYRSGEHRMLLGGDFVDTLELPDGRLALLIGDVSGHGPTAAALGAALRVAWRTLVLQGADAGTTLAGMNAVLLAERASLEAFATVALGWIDAGLAELTLALAGHLPPLLLGPRVQLPLVPSSPPLGVDETARWASVSMPLLAPWGVLLYTDGLIEGRAPGGGRLGLDGLRRLLAAVDPALGGEALLHALHEGARQANGGDLPDDVALLLATSALSPAPRVERRPGAPLSLRLRLPAVAASVPRARHELVELCRTLAVEPSVVDGVALAATEAVTNVLMHAYLDAPEPGVLEIEAWPDGDRLRVTVRDFGRGMLPRADSPGLGLGMQLIATVAEEVDVRREQDPAVTEVVMFFRPRTRTRAYDGA